MRCSACGYVQMPGPRCKRCEQPVQSTLKSRRTEVNTSTAEPTKGMVTSMGGFHLGQRICDAPGLREFTTADYADFRAAGWQPLRSDAQLYHGNDVTFQGSEWRVMVGAVAGKIYKIRLSNVTEDKAASDRLMTNLLHYLKSRMGQYSEHTNEPTVYIWDQAEGNTILDQRPVLGYWGINIFLTAGFIGHLEGVALRQVVRRLRMTLAWNPSQHSDQENLTWSWLRAVEWLNWPLFLSQAFAPFLLLGLGWRTVVAIVLILNYLWVFFVRYRLISVVAAYLGALFVRLKWIACPGVAAYLWLARGETLAAGLALCWPLIILIPLPLVLIAGQIGRVQNMFMSKLGYCRSQGLDVATAPPTGESPR